VDAKIPRRRRDIVPLLCSGTEVLWIMGMRIDQRFLAQADTKRRLVVGVKKR
jgi:tRNA(Ile)-lysidine synthase